jgi:methylated-DNA-[protein]-cysteine S-methyltransferase
MSTGSGTNTPNANIVVVPLDTPLGTARLYGTARGLLMVDLPGETRAYPDTWLRRAARGARFVEDATALPAARAQLTAYFAGQLRDFDLEIDWRGTPFQRAVWDAVCAIPYGETSTYGEIAAVLGRPHSYRAVGAANGANPLAPIVPCHRLIGADGTLRGYGAGLDTKQWLLDLERRNH